MAQSSKWYGWRPDKPDHRDRRMVAQAVSFPAAHFLPDQCIPAIRNQGDQGSCTGHSGRSVVEFVRSYLSQPPLELSPRFIYWNGRVIEGTIKEDSGCEIRDTVKAVVKYGVAQEALCKYNPKLYKVRPSAKAFHEALTDVVSEYSRVPQTKEGIKTALTGNFPIWFGFSVYDNFESDEMGKTGLLGMPSGQMAGGHAVWACGYDDAKKIGSQTGGVLIGNSWGNDWGCQGPGLKERGYFWMPWDYILSSDLADDLWTVRKVT